MAKVGGNDKNCHNAQKELYIYLEMFLKNEDIPMKAFSFAVLLAMPAVFLSCSTGEGDATDVVGGNVNCKIAAKLGYEEVPGYFKELDSYKELGQSCKSEQKKLVNFLNLHLVSEDIDWDYVYSHLPGYVPGSGQVSEGGSAGYSSNGSYTVSHTVNGIDMTQEEYEAYKEEYWRKYNEELDRNQRDLQIPCAITSNVALLTDEEIAKLKETYGELAFEDYSEAVPGYDGVENGEIVPPSCTRANR